MAYDIFQTTRFRRHCKKLQPNVKRDVDDAVLKISIDPKIGERKKRDLSEVFVLKFHSQNQLYLLGYTVDDNVRMVYLEAISPHENFYRDLMRN